MLNELDPRFFLSVFLRRFPVFMLTAVLIFSIATAVAVLLPASYTSTARILVESQQIPSELVQSTVTTHAAERLRVIQQRLMTRENLLDIAAKYNVFPGREDMSPTEVVEAMRADSSFEAEVLGDTGRRNEVHLAMAFNISFSASNPQTAARVAGEYVTRILADNLKLRTSRAADTYEFFDQESDRLSNELASLESKIVDFKRANRSSLPETLDFRTNQLQRVQQRMQLIDREVADMQEQRKIYAEIQQDPTNLFDGEIPLTEAEKARDALQTQLELRSAVLSDQHPEIKSLRARIEALDKMIEADAADGSDSVDQALDRRMARELRRVDREIEVIDTKVAQRQDEMDQLERQEAELERSIAETPNTQMALNALQRNYSNLQEQYENARSKLAVSATGEQLELKQQAERFEVIEQPTVPETPDKPDRLMIVLMGLGGGIAAGIAVIGLLEFLNKSVRRPSDIVKALGMQPLAVIPYIYTETELRRRVRVRWILALSTLAFVVIVLALVHRYYLPLDLLAQRMVEKTKLDTLIDLTRSRMNL